MENRGDCLNVPTPAYIGAAWAALGIGIAGYLIGLWNANMELNEKGYYFAVLLLSLFSSISLEKSVRDRSEGIPVTNIYLGLSWLMFCTSIALVAIGLYNAELELSEKGFYGLAFVLSLFAVMSVQKNIRDLTNAAGQTDPKAFPRVKDAAEAAMDASDIID